MRVIAGKYRSRRIAAPRGNGTRPTSDRLRETLFNVLAPRIEGARFADLYAGSGGVGLEALSRGAGFCCFVERAPGAVAIIRANLAALGVTSGFSIEGRAVAGVLEHLPERLTEQFPEHLAEHLEEAGSGFDLVFLDPPYEAAAEYTGTLQSLSRHADTLLAPGALVIAEHARRTPLPERVGDLARTRLLEQGDAALSFYARVA